MGSMVGTKPQFPFWLSPTQVRILSVKEEFNQECVELAKSLPGRIDVDDREITIGKKIRDAEKEWTPMIVVYGDKEKESGILSIRMRDGKQKELSIEDLRSDIIEKLADFPLDTLAEPMLMSKRVQWR